MFLGDILKTCPDEVFAVISVKDGKFKIRSTKNRANTFYGLDSYFENKNKLNNPIIIVTESPHIDEFDIGDVYDWKTKELVQARPVNGISGQNILQYLCEILTPSVHLSDGTYPVIIINAITKQCSEGKDTLIARTRNFIKLWPQERSYLNKRLREISPSVVICACTVGDFRLPNNDSAYQNNIRQEFEQHFRNLLEQEFDLCEIENNNSTYCFLSAFDLSGLVLNEIETTYFTSDTQIYKTTHPSSWNRTKPTLKKYNQQKWFFNKT